MRRCPSVASSVFGNKFPVKTFLLTMESFVHYAPLMDSPTDISEQEQREARETTLLGPGDPPPIDIVNRDAHVPLFLLCEHAGQAIPKKLNSLGLSQDDINQHIGWDIGAESLARYVATALGSPLIIQRYSRLVIDCNRPPGSEGSIPAISDSVPIPGNVGLGQKDHNRRRQSIFDPMNDAITRMFQDHARRAVFSIHSFTPEFQGVLRPWDAGFLTRNDTNTARLLMDSIAAHDPSLTLGLNNPYQIDDASDWFIPRHAEARDMRHCLIEVRNDHLRDEAGIAHWGTLLAGAIAGVMEHLP